MTTTCKGYMRVSSLSQSSKSTSYLAAIETANKKKLHPSGEVTPWLILQSFALT